MQGSRLMERSSASIAIVGSGGAGVITAGAVLIEAAAHAGLFGLLSRSVGAQIRGGETMALLRIGTTPIEAHADLIDALIVLDWRNLGKFCDEMPLSANSLIVCDAAAGPVPPEFAQYGAREAEFSFKALSQGIAGARANMIALGIAAALVGIPQDALVTALTKSLAGGREKHFDASLAACEAGQRAATGLRDLTVRTSGMRADRRRWSFTGNEAAGLGAVRGGVRFVAAYPITPATELLEGMTPLLDEVGGVLVQVEDELACINQVIGASFGGVPSLTATSGPGLSLMMESIGLAVASETPVVVVDVMRAGPSTGIPAKTEQSDLNIAIYGQHGDAPHLVLAANSIMDCMFTTQWAAHLAESLQTAAIVLSDQFLGQTRMIADRLPKWAGEGGRLTPSAAQDGDYCRYALTASGVSPMSIPGTPRRQYTADGLEHAESGLPSSQARDHAAQLDKRLRKLARFDFGDAWADIEGEGDTAILTWGSCTGAAREAVRELALHGVRARLISVRLLAPLQIDRLEAALAGAKRVLVVELNHSGQFYRYLRSLADLARDGRDVRCFNRAGPLPIKPGEIRERVLHDGH